MPEKSKVRQRIVVSAVDLSNRRDYAIKVLDKRHIIREKKVKYVNIEKNVLYKLDHPGVVKLYSTFQDSASLYYVLELCPNGELLTYIKKLGSFDENCTRFYVAQILTAVEYVHSQDVIHRDLKPENILLDDRMYIKLTDFGTAKMLERSEDGVEGSDRANSFVGTAEYVSPELLTEKAACKSSDLWALGCIIYQLLAGRPPFKGSNEYQTFQKIVKLEYSFPPGFPPQAMDLVSRLLVHDPQERLGAGGPSSLSGNVEDSHGTDVDADKTTTQQPQRNSNNSMDQLKAHPFFDGLDWENLWTMPAPKLLPYLPPTPTHNLEPLRSDHDMTALWKKKQQQQNGHGHGVHGPGAGSPAAAVAGGMAGGGGDHLVVVDPYREMGGNSGATTVSGGTSQSGSSHCSREIIIEGRGGGGVSGGPLGEEEEDEDDGIEYEQSNALAVVPSGVDTRKAKLDLQARLSPWQSFLSENELILYQAPVLKRKGLFSRSCILVLTDKPRLLYFTDSSHYFSWLFDSNTNEAFSSVVQERQQQQQQLRGGPLGVNGMSHSASAATHLTSSTTAALSLMSVATGTPNSSATTTPSATVTNLNAMHLSNSNKQHSHGTTTTTTTTTTQHRRRASIGAAAAMAVVGSNKKKVKKVKQAQLKGEITVSANVVTELKGKKCFFIHTTRKSYYFEEGREGEARVWVGLLEKGVEEWFGVSAVVVGKNGAQR